MSFTTPVTVNPGDAILASLWNEQVRDNMQTLAPAYARISGGTSQTGIVNNTWTKVNSTNPTVTNPLGWTISAGEITIPGATLPGVYSIYGFVQWDSNTTGVRVIQVSPSSNAGLIRLAGTGVTAVGSSFVRTTVSGLTIISTNETLILSVLQDSGGNRDLSQNNADFFVCRVAPLV